MGGGIPSRQSVIAAAMLAPFGAGAKAADVDGPLTAWQRQQRVFERRRDAAQAELDSDPPEPMTNGCKILKRPNSTLAGASDMGSTAANFKIRFSHAFTVFRMPMSDSGARLWRELRCLHQGT